MYICIYVYIYIYVFIHMYTYIYVYIYIYLEGSKISTDSSVVSCMINSRVTCHVHVCDTTYKYVWLDLSIRTRVNETCHTHETCHTFK